MDQLYKAFHSKYLIVKVYQGARNSQMANKLEMEEYLYRRAIDIIESTDTDDDKERLLFQEVWLPLAELYKDRIVSPKR